MISFTQDVMHVVMPWVSQVPSCPAPPPGAPPFNCTIPDPPPEEPTLPGFARVVQLVSNIRWVGGLALVAIFFIGIIVWSVGRGIDHHRAGRTGTIMMLVGVLGGLAWALGPALIRYMAGQ